MHIISSMTISNGNDRVTVQKVLLAELPPGSKFFIFADDKQNPKKAWTKLKEPVEDNTALKPNGELANPNREAVFI